LKVYSFARLPGPALAAVKWFSITAAIVVIPVLLLSMRKAHTPAPTNTESAGSLPLTLTGENGRLSLGWNPEAPAIRAGQCGVLWISDGGISSRLTMDVSQLRVGKLVYWPVNKAVSFEIRMPGEMACHSNAASLRQPAEGPHSRKRRAERHRRDIVKPEGVSASVNVAQNEASNAAAFAIQGESQLAATLPVDTIQGSAVGEKQIRTTAIRPAPQTAPEPRSSVTVEAVAVTESRLSRIAARIPVLRRLHRTPEYLPPRPVRESTPAVPAELRRNMKSEVPVDVRAFIDESGKVVYTEMLSNVTEADRNLASMAVFDARRWEFTPAQLGGRTVAGEVILHYRFGNPLLAVSRDQR
jgi:hypothetical protein